MSARCHRTLLLLVIASSTPAFADEIHWVGYQAGPPGGLSIWEDQASYFHGDQWFNYLVPGVTDTAIFDESFDPQGNGMPHDVYFGDFTVDAVPIYVPNSFVVPGGDATLGSLVVARGSFTFRFTDDTGMPQGSLSVVDAIQVQSPDAASLTLFRGDVASKRVALGSANGTARLVIDDARLEVDAVQGAFDVGIAGTKAVATVTGNSSLTTGYQRIGENAGSEGTLRVVGALARVESRGMQVGATGAGTLEVRDGAEFHSRDSVWLGVSGVNSRGDISLENAGSALHIDGNIVVGASGFGNVTIHDGAAMANHHAFVGSEQVEGIGSGSVFVAGSGTTWSSAGDVYVGHRGSGSLDVADHAQVTVGNRLELGPLGRVDLHDDGVINVGGGDAPPPGWLRAGPGGALAGSGEVVGNVLVEGGSVQPGSSPGALRVDGDLQLKPGSLLSMEIAGIDAGDEYDQLLVTGDLSLQGLVQIAFIDGFSPQVGDSFDLFRAGGELVAPDALVFLNPPGAFDYTTAINDGVFSLTVTSVPEPPSILLACFAAASAWFRRRRALRVGRTALQ